MKPLSQKTVFAILMGAMFMFCVILALESNLTFGWMLGGFVLVFVVSFVFLYVRVAPLVIIGTIVLIGVGYLLFKIGGNEAVRKGRGLSTAIGAIAAIVTVMMLQFGWVKPSQEANVNVEDYRKQQQAIYEQEKARKEAAPSAQLGAGAQGGAPVVQAPVVQDPPNKPPA